MTAPNRLRPLDCAQSLTRGIHVHISSRVLPMDAKGDAA